MRKQFYLESVIWTPKHLEKKVATSKNYTKVLGQSEATIHQKLRNAS